MGRSGKEHDTGRRPGLDVAQYIQRDGGFNEHNQHGPECRHQLRVRFDKSMNELHRIACSAKSRGGVRSVYAATNIHAIYQIKWLFRRWQVNGTTAAVTVSPHGARGGKSPANPV
ncbi:hypothetical protein KB20921_12980 [Edwardsiella ictaluri]|nr:hypothetical protein KH20906_12690 [Edwardsiella ictaluri]BEI02037.1 hypothetical protein KB20921_12980 [Edwardsiella ictaluri]BEI05506.1 hypothetical protein KH201010_12920 [Edwardsiella ictaluri]BEI08966.1 hypothetical protein STU22726_12970 [Edwardsiella ictaluri]BEI12443.1 hypothetical protein STU22816_12960 [Edwardsiella ictaluri]